MFLVVVCQFEHFFGVLDDVLVVVLVIAHDLFALEIGFHAADGKIEKEDGMGKSFPMPSFKVVGCLIEMAIALHNLIFNHDK